MKKFIAIISFLIVGLNAPASVAGEWSGYQYWVEVDGVVMYMKYKQKSCGTDIKWKAENTSAYTVSASVVDKKYNCNAGGSVSRPDEGFSFDLKPGRSYSTQPDSCVCKGSGGVANMEAVLQMQRQ